MEESGPEKELCKGKLRTRVYEDAVASQSRESIAFSASCKVNELTYERDGRQHCRLKRAPLGLTPHNSNYLRWHCQCHGSAWPAQRLILD